jgi:hypothetical protein
MHVATLSVVVLAGLAALSVGNGTLRCKKSLLRSFADVVAVAMLTVFWFAFFHVLNS